MTRLWDAVTVAPSTIARVAAEQYVPIPEPRPATERPRPRRPSRGDRLPDVAGLVAILRAEGYGSVRVYWGVRGFMIEARNRAGHPETLRDTIAS